MVSVDHPRGAAPDAPAPERLLAKLSRLRHELAKFVAVGGVCFVVDFMIAHVLHNDLGVGPIKAKTVSTVVATGLSYLGYRLWSFAHRIDAEETTHTRDLVKYSLINLIGLVLTLLPIAFVEYVLNLKTSLDYDISQVVWTGMATLFRFWGYRRYVFTGNGALEESEREALV